MEKTDGMEKYDSSPNELIKKFQEKIDDLKKAYDANSTEIKKFDKKYYLFLLALSIFVGIFSCTMFDLLYYGADIFTSGNYFFDSLFLVRLFSVISCSALFIGLYGDHVCKTCSNKMESINNELKLLELQLTQEKEKQRNLDFPSCEDKQTITNDVVQNQRVQYSIELVDPSNTIPGQNGPTLRRHK